MHASPRTVLEAGSAISGKLSYDLPVKIDGRFKGELKARGLLVLGPNADVSARIIAENLRVEGKLVGKIHVTGSVEILPGGQFRGEVVAGRLTVCNGAVFEGKGSVSRSGADGDQLPRPSSP